MVVLLSSVTFPIELLLLVPVVTLLMVTWGLYYWAVHYEPVLWHKYVDTLSYNLFPFFICLFDNEKISFRFERLSGEELQFYVGLNIIKSSKIGNNFSFRLIESETLASFWP